MEPITTAVAISSVVSYLSQTLKDNKAFKDFATDFTAASVNWMRSIFLEEDDNPKEVLADLQADPTEELNVQAAENAIAKAVKKDAEAEKWLKEMYEVIQQKKADGQQVSVHVENSERVNTGNISAGGNVTQSFGNTDGK